jgi:hypothetical protein
MAVLTTLIPARKSAYLGELFAGLQTQTLRDFRVVLSDDSPNGEITELLQTDRFRPMLQGLELRVVQGPRAGSFRNVQHLLAGWGHETPLVHLHMDDDVLYPEFYRAHALAHARHAPGASVSQRWVTSVAGRPAAVLPLPAFVHESNERVLKVDADRLFATTAAHCENWLGECTNTVLSAEGVRRLQGGRMHGLSYYGLGDIGVLLDVSRHAPIAFIRDHLSGFRSHPQQATAQTRSLGLKCGYLAWAALALAGWRDGRLSAEQTVQALTITLQRCVRQYGADDEHINGFFAVVAEHASDLSSFEAAFRAYWNGLLALTGEVDAPAAPEPAMA